MCDPFTHILYVAPMIDRLPLHEGSNPEIYPHNAKAKHDKVLSNQYAIY